MSGEAAVKSHCLPFSEIPHTTRLFSDFLSDAPAVHQFYPRSARFTDWFSDEVSRIQYDSTRRELISDILARQNKPASSRTLENIGRLRRGAAAVVTGQQVGILGGPVFSIYKALTAVKLANEATAAGVDAVPIFWLATEDHDLAEVSHIALPAREYVPQRIETTTHGLLDAAVGEIRFGDEITSVSAEAADLLGPSDTADLLRESYRPGETFGSAFARLFTKLFADWGVILLDASDLELHRIAEPLYRSAIARAAELDNALLERGKALETAGYHQQVKVTPSSTLLFAFRDGARVAIHRRANGNGADFLIGDQKIPQAELLRQIAAAPHQFSANVLLRPVLQDFLLPTLAYTGGAAEVAYFAQAAVVYEDLLKRVTPVVPRFSATLVEPKIQGLLDRYHLAFTDLVHGPERLREVIATHALPSDLQSAFDQADASLEKSLQAVRETLDRLDSTLVDAARRAGLKMHYQLKRLRSRAARAELTKTEILARHAALLSNALFPNKTLQEREVAGVYFVARYGRELLGQLYETIHPDCLDHQIVSL
jgi:bacillithiol biosynthesis cysteine-adding enzyme BshC